MSAGALDFDQSAAKVVMGPGLTANTQSERAKCRHIRVAPAGEVAAQQILEGIKLWEGSAPGCGLDPLMPIESHSPHSRSALASQCREICRRLLGGCGGHPSKEEDGKQRGVTSSSGAVQPPAS